MAKKPLKYHFRVSPGQLYDLLLKSVVGVGYSITSQVRSDGIINCKTGMTWKSWSGVEIGMLVEASSDGYSEVTFGGGTMASAGIRPIQIAVVGNAVKGPSRKITDRVHRYIKIKQIPLDRPLVEKNASSTTVVSVADELEKLVGLRDKGVLTPGEFEAEKGKLLSR